MLWLAVAIAAFGGGVVHTITGFGAGIVMMAIMPYFLGMIEAPAISSIICTFLSAALAWKNRKVLQWKLILFPAVVYISASTFVISKVQYLDLDLLGILFGIFLILLCAYYMFFAKRFAIPNSTGILAACSAFSGVTAGLFGIGGPLMAICFLMRTEDRESYTGNLQMLFVCTGLSSLTTRIINGIFTIDMVPAVLLGVLFINVGKKAGLKIAEKIDAEMLKRIIYLFVGFSGVLTLVEHI